MATAGRIDTHHHIVPPAYATWLRKKGIEAGGLPIPDWSLDAAISLMDKLRIQTSIMSITTPGVHLGDDGASSNGGTSFDQATVQSVQCALDGCAVKLDQYPVSSPNCVRALPPAR